MSSSSGNRDRSANAAADAYTTSSSRKRSRWESESTDASTSRGQPHVGPPPKTSSAAAAVSDQEALQALLSSAQSRQHEKEDARTKSRSHVHSQQRRRNHQEEDRRNSRRPRDDDNNNNDNNNYYGPAAARRSTSARVVENEGADDRRKDFKSATAATTDPSSDDPPPSVEPTHKPDFGLSGALAKDEVGGNVYKGVVLKFSEPPEARAPNTQWRLYVFKQEDLLETLHVAKQSAYLIGRNADICDVHVAHGSCSSQHAVLQYRALTNTSTNKLQCRPYVMDLESTNGTFLNGVRIDAARYYELKKGDVVKFGASTRDYVLLTANTTAI